ncbi:MAG: hypothetical protein ACLQDY_20350 [Streptosporangiaceae bacterium]
MSLAAEQDAALGPVRDGLLRRAAGQAEEIVAAARRQADEITGLARRAAARAAADGQADGEAQGAPLSAAEISRGRREARQAVLAAREAARAELARQVRAAAGALRGDPGYPQLRDRLAQLAARAAGPGAAVTEHPDGGVLASAPGVLVDLSLPRLADRAVEALGSQAARLWTP